MLFELITDLRRWRSDRQVNNYEVERVYADKVSGDMAKDIAISAHLQVGDIIVL